MSKLRHRGVPGQSKSGVSASESRAPPGPWYLRGAWGERELSLGSWRVHLRWVLQAGRGLAPHRERVHLQGRGEEETEGQGDRRDRRPAGHDLAPQPMWQHLRWLCGSPWGPGPARLGQPCQPGHGAGALGWLPHGGQPPQPRNLQEGNREMPLSWRNCDLGKGQPIPWAPPETRAMPHCWDQAHSGARHIVGPWQTTFLGCHYEEWVPTGCITLGQPQFPHLYNEATDITYLCSCEG